MDFNSLLLRFGLNSFDFENKLNEPIETHNPKGYIYEVEQSRTKSPCPKCLENTIYIKGYYETRINCRQSEHINDTLVVRRVRFKCRDCGLTWSPQLRGIAPYQTISRQTNQLIINDLVSALPFRNIAQKYDLTTARVMQIFDDHFKYVPRLKMPKVLCLDEIHFSQDVDQRYLCILYDFHRREIVDIIRNRQMPYLREYFNEIPEYERKSVEIVISDMYDAYSTITRLYFPKAIHIVDLFHVIRLLTTAVNTIRTRVMNQKTERKSASYNFMKRNWKLFLCRYTKVPDRFYTHKKTNVRYHYDELIRLALTADQDLALAYNTMQDLFRYEQKFTHDEALNFIMRISHNLRQSSNEIVKKVGDSYHKWRIEIANALSYTQNKIRYTNAIAENINNQLKTITKAAYGYSNFERFRKRAMLLLSYKKKS